MMISYHHPMTPCGRTDAPWLTVHFLIYYFQIACVARIAETATRARIPCQARRAPQATPPIRELSSRRSCDCVSEIFFIFSISMTQ